MRKESNLSTLEPIIAVPLGLKAHFDNPPSSGHMPKPGFEYIDPTHPGHDFLSDPEPVKRSVLGRFLGR